MIYTNKIYFNGFSLVQEKIFGIHRYSLEILKELDKIVPPDSVYVVIPKGKEGTLHFNNIVIELYQKSCDSKMSMFMWELYGFAGYVVKKKGISVDLTLSLPFRGCDIVAIHDCIQERFPQNADSIKRKIIRKLYLYRVKCNLKKAKEIITVSNSSKEDLIYLYRLNDKAINVIPNSWQHYDCIKPELAVIERLNLSGKQYFFALGSRFYHKNIKWIVEAAKQNMQSTFVVTGEKKFSGTEPFTEDEVTSNIIFTGYLTDEEIKALMIKCKAFIQPSLCEGFGIPPMEAMSCGTKCILSTAPALPEIYGDSVWYIDPLDYDHIDMDEIMSKEIKDNSDVLKKYSWEKSAEKMWDVLKKYL